MSAAMAARHLTVSARGRTGARSDASQSSETLASRAAPAPLRCAASAHQKWTDREEAGSRISPVRAAARASCDACQLHCMAEDFCAAGWGAADQGDLETGRGDHGRQQCSRPRASASQPRLERVRHRHGQQQNGEELEARPPGVGRGPSPGWLRRRRGSGPPCRPGARPPAGARLANGQHAERGQRDQGREQQEPSARARQEGRERLAQRCVEAIRPRRLGVARCPGRSELGVVHEQNHQGEGQGRRRRRGRRLAPQRRGRDGGLLGSRVARRQRLRRARSTRPRRPGPEARRRRTAGGSLRPLRAHRPRPATRGRRPPGGRAREPGTSRAARNAQGHVEAQSRVGERHRTEIRTRSRRGRRPAPRRPAGPEARTGPRPPAQWGARWPSLRRSSASRHCPRRTRSRAMDPANRIDCPMPKTA